MLRRYSTLRHLVLRHGLQRQVSAVFVFGVAACFVPSAHAQQVNAGAGDNIPINGQTITTSGIPALLAQDGGRIFNSPGPGNAVTINTSGASAYGALATTGGVINLDGGGTVTTNGFMAAGLVTTAGSTITSSAIISTMGVEATGAFANGGTITIDGGSITTGSDTAYGAYANGGLITLKAGVAVTTSGVSANGLVAGGGGMVVSAASVSTTNNTAFGVYVGGPGTINLTGGSITTSGNQAFGLNAEGAGSSITSVVDVTTNGANAYGAYALNGGVVNLTGGQIITNGPTSVGLAAINGSLTSTADVTTNGNNSFGVYAANAGSVILNGGSITTHGIGSYGMYIETTGGTITSVADITTTGDAAIAAYAQAGTLTLNGGTITTSGTSAHGIEARGAGVATATGVTINVSGTTAAGVVAADGGTLTFASGTITSAQGLALGSQAITGQTNTVFITDSQLTSTTNTAMMFQGGIHNVTIANSQVTGGNGQLLQVDYRQIPPATYPTALVLNVTGSTLTGDMQVVDPGTNTANVTLSASTTWTGASQGLTNLTVDSSTWNVTGVSTLTGTLTNGGTIAFAADGPFKTITTPSYVGNSGTMNFNTALGGDNSPTDKLIINGGSATGSTTVNVANKGGTGGMTSGTGIPLIVATGGATTGGAFTLGGSGGRRALSISTVPGPIVRRHAR